jgi:hypothetical protein
MFYADPMGRFIGLALEAGSPEVQTMPQTGSKCPQSGIYQGDDAHKEQIALSKDEIFPPCGDCKRAVGWSLVRATQ